MIILTVFFTKKIGVIVKTDASDFSYIVHATQAKNVLLLRVETIHLVDIVLHVFQNKTLGTYINRGTIMLKNGWFATVIL